MSFVYHSIYIGYTISTDVYAMYIHWMLKCLLGITNIGPVSKISIVPDLKASVGQCWLDLIITYIRPILATNVVPISSLVGRHWPNTGPLVNSYMGSLFIAKKDIINHTIYLNNYCSIIFINYITLMFFIFCTYYIIYIFCL